MAMESTSVQCLSTMEGDNVLSHGSNQFMLCMFIVDDIHTPSRAFLNYSITFPSWLPIKKLTAIICGAFYTDKCPLPVPGSDWSCGWHLVK